jgi:hypothetical protein
LQARCQEERDHECGRCDVLELWCVHGFQAYRRDRQVRTEI